MSERKVTKTFTITANESLMGSIERFLACLHLNTSWGHSSIVGLSQDGDGWDEVVVTGEDFNVQKYRVYTLFISDYPCKGAKRVESVDGTLMDKDYLAYREKWQKKNGHLYEGEEQPWMED